MLRNIHFQKWNKDRYNFMKTIYEMSIRGLETRLRNICFLTVKQ